MAPLRSKLAALAAGLTLALGSSADRAHAYRPESPEVQRMVQRAVAFIEENYPQPDVNYYHLGRWCLSALAVYKHTGQDQHRLVQAAVERCRAACREGVPWGTHNNYSVGIAVIFLCDLDARQYRPEIEILTETLIRRQQLAGGWSYQPSKTGDTSQTQYAVLGCWMASRHGIPVPQDTIERVCNWLIRTQAPNGSWGYQGKDPGNFQRQIQDKETLSLAAAGLGSTYVCAEMLGFVQERSEVPSRRERSAALRKVKPDRPRRRGPLSDAVPRAFLERTLRDGNNWFSRNFNIEALWYQHYYMYALERYMSFRELSERNRTAEPSWYNQGVAFLRGTQANDGSWQSEVNTSGKIIDTSFAVLFLLRSTQRSLGALVEESGRLRGGKSLPHDLSQIAVDPRGQIVSTKETPPLEELLEMLEDLGTNRFDSSIPQQLELSDDPQARASQVARLRRLAMGGSYQARLTAVTTLGRDRDLDHVPVLIYALSDPDPRVIRAADDGLRFISRKISGFGLSRTPTRIEAQAAREAWQDWYRSIRPESGLIE